MQTNGDGWYSRPWYRNYSGTSNRLARECSWAWLTCRIREMGRVNIQIEESPQVVAPREHRDHTVRRSQRQGKRCEVRGIVLGPSDGRRVGNRLFERAWNRELARGAAHCCPWGSRTFAFFRGSYTGRYSPTHDYLHLRASKSTRRPAADLSPRTASYQPLGPRRTIYF